jgi:trimethylamine--corrinoid protein Co-methyltransferase
MNQGGDHIWDFRTGELRPATLPDLVLESRLIDACEYIDGAFTPAYWLYDILPKDSYDRYGLWNTYMAVMCLHTGKPKFTVYSSSIATEIPDLIRTYQIAAGGEEEYRKKPNGSNTVGPVSPLSIHGRREPDDPWGHADSLLEVAKSGCPMAISPCGLLGLSGPVTAAGMLAQSIAEYHAMNVATQTINPGHPVFIVDYLGSTDMFTGEKHPSDPDANLLHLGLMAMGHYLNVAVWSMNNSTSTMADAQMGWENMGSFMPQYIAGMDIIGSVGALAADDIFDPCSLVMGNEIIQWIKHFSRGIRVDDETIPLDEMIKLGPYGLGGEYLSSKHTRRLFKTELWHPKITSTLDRDAWVKAGSKSAYERASELAGKLLENHEPQIPEEQQKAMRDFIAEILDREGIKGDEAKEIMEKTYWQGL